MTNRKALEFSEAISSRNRLRRLSDEESEHCDLSHRRLNHKRRRLDLSRGYLPLLFVILAVCSSAGSHAGDEDVFSLSRLSVADKLLDLASEDLNADGLKDILIVHRKGLPPDETRWISIFWQREDGGFSTAADQSWALDTAAVIMDTGDITGDGRREICYLTAGEVRYYPIESGNYETEPEVLLEAGGLTVFPSRSSIPLINFVRDWNDDGRDEVGIFRFEGLSVYSPDSTGGYSSGNEILIELDTEMSRAMREYEDMMTSGLRARFTFPDISLVDCDGDGDWDLIATTEDRMMIYRHDEGGRFSSEPESDVLFDVRTQHEKIEDLAQLQTTVTDLNGDGYADAVVTKQTSKGLSNFRGVINIFHGGVNGYTKEPQQVIISEGTASSRTFIRDVNGDGRLDLILPSVKISITSIIRWLITRSIPVNFNIFLLNEDSRFSDRPDFTKEVKFKIDLSGESDTQAMDLDGDYNGDKRKDFVFATDEDELSIYLGVREGGDRLFSKKPAAKVRADAFGELRSPDLNGDGYSDMIIYYPQSKERKGNVQVLINLKRIK